MQTARVWIKVFEAKGLQKDGGLPDPYCSIYWNGTRIGKTKTEAKTSEPCWNEDFYLEKKVSDLIGSVFYLEVYHGTLIKDTFLGEISIKWDEIKEANDINKWKKLTPSPKKPDKYVGGELHYFCKCEFDTKEVSYTDFEILHLIGKGSFGKVFQVRRKKNKQIYAMKVLSKKELVTKGVVDHILQEREVLIKINHPFLVNLIFAFQTETKVCFVMDYVNGGELLTHLQNDFRFSEPRTAFYAAELLLGLMFLHSHDIIYRDLKPENILLDFEGHVRITDFGLSKQGISSADPKRNTFCGTPMYMPPEMVEGYGYDQSADWWSWGVLIFEMLSGVPPFNDRSIQGIFEKIKECNLHFPPFFSDQAKELLYQVLAKDRNRRLTDPNVIKTRLFFSKIDWDRVENKKFPVPFVPKVKGDKDVKNFNQELTEIKPNAEDVFIPGRESQFVTDPAFSDWAYVDNNVSFTNQKNNNLLKQMQRKILKNETYEDSLTPTGPTMAIFMDVQKAGTILEPNMFPHPSQNMIDFFISRRRQTFTSTHPLPPLPNTPPEPSIRHPSNVFTQADVIPKKPNPPTPSIQKPLPSSPSQTPQPKPLPATNRTDLPSTTQTSQPKPLPATNRTDLPSTTQTSQPKPLPNPSQTSQPKPLQSTQDQPSYGSAGVGNRNQFNREREIPTGGSMGAGRTYADNNNNSLTRSGPNPFPKNQPFTPEFNSSRPEMTKTISEKIDRPLPGRGPGSQSLSVLKASHSGKPLPPRPPPTKPEN